MAKSKISVQHVSEEESRKHRTQIAKYKPTSVAFDDTGLEKSPLIETPFMPSLSQHVKGLSNAQSDKLKTDYLLKLQRTYGNNYVQRLIDKVKLQAKLSVSKPGDSSEQEADKVADAVSRVITSDIQRQELPEEEELQTKTLLRQELPEEEELQTKTLLRQELPEEEELQTKTLLHQEIPEEEEELQLQSNGGVAAVSQQIEEHINQERGGSQSLADNVRKPMERAFGVDFSGVRVHTDAEADLLNRQLTARAFTTGQDIFFRAGEYSPGSGSGQKLIAHELTHVVQQTGTGIHRQNLEGIARSGLISRQEGEEEISQNTAGTLPDYEEEEGVQKGPDDLEKREARRQFANPSNKLDVGSTQTAKCEICADDVNFDFSSSRTTLNSSVESNNAKQSHKEINVAWKNPGGQTVKPFGSENFKPGYKNLNWAWKQLGKKINLGFTLDINCPWGTNSGGRKNITSATDALVSIAEHPSGKKVYEVIADDLTPFKEEQCWTAPRTEYWSQALVERHEKYHSTDDKKWAEGPGKKVVVDYLKGKKINGNNIDAELPTLMDNAVKKMSQANWEFYTGGASSYYSYAGEIRAFGDCKDEYLKLAKNIRKQGAKLEKEVMKQEKEAKKKKK